MKVRLTVQVKLFPVIVSILTTGPADTNAPAKLCFITEIISDCLNLRNTEDYKFNVNL